MQLDKDAKLNLSRNGSTHLRGTQSEVPDDVETDYKDYINSIEWVELKSKSNTLWGCKCLVCQSGGKIDRHHVFYRKNLLKSHQSEIIPLCEKCHSAAHEEGDNKNQQPLTFDALQRLVAKLFHCVVRRRGLPTPFISQSSKRFWAKFMPHKTQLFDKKELKIVNVKTVYTQKERDRIFGKKKKKRKNRDKPTPVKLSYKPSRDYSPEGIERRWQEHLEWERQREQRDRERKSRLPIVHELDGKSKRDRELYSHDKK